MKKIGIDCRLIARTGVGTYIKNLIYHLEKFDTSGINFKLYLMKDNFHVLKTNKPNFQKVLADYHWHSFEEQFQFYLNLMSDKLDLMHFTYFTYPFLYRRKFIATIHDLTPILFKTGRASTKNQLVYQFKHAMFRLVLNSEINNAIKIITPCKTVKNQIIDQYGQQLESKIVPIYEGVNYELTSTKENINLNQEFEGGFLIYIGNFYPHKNVENLIKAYVEVHGDKKLILIGPDDYFSQRINQLIKELKQEKRIILYKNPTLADLVFFYKNALGLVNPSLSEGFGLPLIEAAYFDCPIIASDIPVFNELFSVNFIKFNPRDTNEIAYRIDDFLLNKPKFDYHELVKQYNFAEMASEILALYQRTFLD